jgi:phospholipid/cholesterol/gamma-HCH transport system ATP-binding protein
LILATRRRYPVTSIVVTHDMRAAQKVADRVVMLYPHAQLAEGERQIVYDGEPAGIATAADPRVAQFVRGEAGDRLREIGARTQPDGRPSA